MNYLFITYKAFKNNLLNISIVYYIFFLVSLILLIVACKVFYVIRVLPKKFLKIHSLLDLLNNSSTRDF